MDYVTWIRQKVGKERIFLNVANAIIVNNQKQILLQRRSDHTTEAWSIPGGVMELGESATQAVLREVREETGLTIDIDYFLGAYTADTQVSYPNGDQCQIIMFSFVCHPVAGQLKINDSESLELTYVDPRNRPTLFRRHLEQVLKDYLAGKQGLIA